VAILAIIYAVSAELGLKLSYINNNVTLVWPPSGLSLAALLLFGVELWPGIALGALLANFFVSNNVILSGVTMAGNTLEAVTAFCLLRKGGFHPAFDRMRDFLQLIGAGMVSCSISAALGTFGLYITQVVSGQPFYSVVYGIWWLGDMMSVLILTPFLLVWGSQNWPKRSQREWLEAMVIFDLVLIASWVIFSGWLASEVSLFLVFVLFPPMVWSALRFEQFGSTMVNLWVSVFSILATVRGQGPFAVANVQQSLLLLHTFLMVGATTTLAVGVVTTQRARAKAALIKSEERLELALQGADLGLWDWHIPLGKRLVSARWAGMLGYTLAEVSPEAATWEQLIHPDDLFSVLEQLNRHLVGETIYYESEHRLKTKTGSWKWVLDRGKVVEWDSQKQPIRVTGTHLDITERKQSTAEQEKLREHLYQVQKIESMGRLAGGIAHDFNNLLVPILGYADLALSNLAADNPIYGDLEQIRNAAQRARELTRQFLAISRKQVLDMRVINLNQLLQEIQKVLQRLIRENIEMEFILDENLGNVKADPTKIEQIILNLAINASDAMPQGGKLTFETANIMLGNNYTLTHVGVLPGPYIMLVVTDTGIGMDQKTQNHIFEPFFTTKERGKGTGLGLAVVYGVVKQHGGNIRVYSEVGRGTTFRIYIPQVSDSQVEAVSLAQANQQPLAQGTETVMVVEDETMVRQFVCDILRSQGYQVIEIAHPQEALRCSEQVDQPLDLLLTDVIMPQMNGPELYQKLVAMRPQLKVLYMSGYTDNVIIEQTILQSELQFLQKPFSIKGLTQKVRDVLGNVAL